MGNEKRPVRELLYDGLISLRTAVILSALTSIWGIGALGSIAVSNHTRLSETIEEGIGYNIIPDEITEGTMINTLGVTALLLTLLSYFMIKSLPKELADRLPS